jgi:hypothetical protein
MPEPTTPARRISDRAALTPIACLIAVWTLAGAVCALRWAGLETPAVVVAYVALPVAAVGMVSTVWVFARYLEATAEIPRQRAELEAEQPSGGDGDA